MHKSLEELIKTPKYCIAVLLLLCAVFVQPAACRPVSAAAGNSPQPPSPTGQDLPRGQVIMVIVDQITWQEFVNGPMPVLHKLAGQGAVGLMTTNPAAGQLRIPDNTYATIGAGAKIGGGPAGGLSLNAGEPYDNDLAADEYYRRTGRPALPGQILQLGIVQMEKSNLRLKYDFSAGALGTILHQNGLKTAVIGNADPAPIDVFQQKYQRQAAIIAMDAAGRVDYGDVSARTTKPDSGSLVGVSADYEYILRQFDELRNRAALVVLETGDISRINGAHYLAAADALKHQRQRALASVDEFLGHLLERVNLNRDLLMVVVPGPPGWAMAEGRFLTPFVMAGHGITAGVVWSGTIKRAGLISNTDIAPTVLRHFGIPAVIKERPGLKEIRLSGQEIGSQSTAVPLEKISKTEANAVFAYNARYPLVKGYITGTLIIVASVMAAIAWRRTRVKYGYPLLVGCTVVPGVLLWASYLPHPSVAAVILEVIILTACVTWVILQLGRKDPLRPFLITTGITALMIMMDILVGAPLAKTSPFSYDVMSGARYYGIGNEYMGVLIGCVAVFAGLLLDTFTRRAGIIRHAAVVLFLAVIYIIAAPNLGTNVGGTIAAVAGLGAAGLILYGGRVNKRLVALIGGCIALVLACFISYDLTRTVDTQSHIGRTVSLIRSNGFTEITYIISRKWEVNYKLITSTSWSLFYFMSLLAFPLFNRIQPALTAEFRQRNPWFHKLLGGIMLGSVFALIFNDSGIVAAATMIIFAVAPYLTGMIKSDELRVASSE